MKTIENKEESPKLANAAVSRRNFLRGMVVAAAAPSIVIKSLGQSARKVSLRPIHREVFLPAPREGASVLASTFYTQRMGLDLVSIHTVMSRSDTSDVAYFRYSQDNGRTWVNGGEFPTFGVRPQGKLRRFVLGCVVDPVTGRFLNFRNEGVLPTDDPLEAFMREWSVYYRASEDGGMTWYLDEEVIQSGKEFGPTHPVRGVHTGHNSVMIGDLASRPIYLANGTLLLPLVISLVGPAGNYYNPGGGYTYGGVAVLRGRWAADGRHMDWEELSQLVEVDPNLSTRGMDEPTLAELPGGRLMMVMRGSNDKKPELPGRRWVAYSDDQGRSWTKPVPWTYMTGETFFSPASSSQLLAHSSGRIFWMGNITPANPSGNGPRYPFIIGEVDRRSGLLDKGSIRIIDDRHPDDGALLALSSPSSREDRESGEIVLNMTRWGAHSVGATYNWTADAYLYRIPVV